MNSIWRVPFCAVNGVKSCITTSKGYAAGVREQRCWIAGPMHPLAR